MQHLAVSLHLVISRDDREGSKHDKGITPVMLLYRLDKPINKMKYKHCKNFQTVVISI